MKKRSLTLKVKEDEDEAAAEALEALRVEKKKSPSPGNTESFVCAVGVEHSCGLTAGQRDPFVVDALPHKCLLASWAPQVITCRKGHRASGGLRWGSGRAEGVKKRETVPQQPLPSRPSFCLSFFYELGYESFKGLSSRHY